MPASLFHESDHHQGTGAPNATGANTLEEQRALQLALELTMLGLMNDEETIPTYADTEQRSKKSQNTTECVPVPSSEHVAEIVGRQGCKIKALRAKTNTYIKTPVRGEEPVFVVTGRKEDVSAAKREILSAAEHFSQIRAQRKNNLNGSLNGPNANVPGQTTIQVRVPYRVVGLVVGPKGATIKRIQQQTNTYIITPSRDKEPTFEVTGLPDNVETARKEIEAHIAIRTGGIIDSTTGGSSSHSSSDSDSGAQDFTTTSSSSPLFNGMENPFSPVGSSGLFGKNNGDPFASFTSATNTTTSSLIDDLLSPQTQDIFNFNLNNGGHGANNNSLNNKLNNGVMGGGKLSDLYSTFNGTGFNYGGFSNFYERDEGIGESPTFDSFGANIASTQASLNSNVSSLWPDFINGSSNAAITTTATSSSTGVCAPVSSSSSSSVFSQRASFPTSTVSPLGRRNSGIGSQNSP